MNKKFLKLVFGIISSVGVATLLCVSFPDADIAYAQGLSTPSNSGGQLFCKRDFSNFLANGIDLDGEGFTDYWRDLTVIYNNNYCQFTDIMSLLDRIDKVRKQMREAFYVCDSVGAARLKAQYFELSAEVYYLRHFVNVSGPPNPKASDAEKMQNIVDDLTVHDAFINRFVNQAEYFNQEQAETIYTKFKQKYANKIEAYRNCTDPNLGALKQKVADIKGTLESIQNMGKRFVERTNNVISKTQQRIAANPGLLSAFSADNVGDAFGSIAKFRANGENFTTSTVWESISNTAKEVTPGVQPKVVGSNSPITMNAINNDLTIIEKRNTAENLDITYMSEYDIKYRQSTGIGLDQLTINLDDLHNTLTSTYDPMNKVQVCAANIVGKQCGG